MKVWLHYTFSKGITKMKVNASPFGPLKVELHIN